MLVFSAFDGCAGAREALKRTSLPLTHYWASEIDKYAIKVALKNHPDIQHVGDIRFITDTPHVDLMIGGPPCQDLSIAGTMKGLKGERSSLFFDFLRLRDKIKPRWYILENVASMRKKDQEAITSYMGVEPVLIDSALVSAQQRKRLYWTNIPVEQPEDKDICLAEIIDDGVVDRYKSYCIDANYWKGTTAAHRAKHHARQVVFKDEESAKAFNLQVRRVRQNTPDQLGYIGENRQGCRVYGLSGKTDSLSANGGGWGAKTGLYRDKDHIRKLTPVECERLQTFPDNYTEGVSNTQRYKMLGNSFTVDVIAHILKELPQ